MALKSHRKATTTGSKKIIGKAKKPTTSIATGTPKLAAKKSIKKTMKRTGTGGRRST